MSVSVIIPALNEAESIGYTVNELPWAEIQECLVVDNGSTDATAEVAAAAGARVVRAARGYGSACLAGVAAASAASEILVFMDGDGADVPTHLPELVAPIQRGEQDLVLGTRLGGDRRGRVRQPGSMLGSQVFAGWFVGQIVRLVYGFRYTDMCAFRAIRRDALDRLKMQERTYGWNLEMQIKAVQHHLRVQEIPVSYRVRYGGVSKVSGDWRASIKAATRILEVLIRVTRQGRS
ncbi:glycosyltransferase family 2 protein [Terriglobus aquaticus]|uniref:Glycosyltransferase family 2 protein n=1 Tax=Terriglobus aquaticus TaxID=940139 RepID=A0ABW9KK62_9BACT|nr:glycosyltransferase family 2 protein [Terriglobus aquaticus]